MSRKKIRRRIRRAALPSLRLLPRPFGPFRINLSYPLLKQPGDDTKRLSFNVGTQF